MDWERCWCAQQPVYRYTARAALGHSMASETCIQNTRQTHHVPTISGPTSRLRVATTLLATSRPVRGFASLGMFSISRVKRALSASTTMRWQLRLTPGSAQISSSVRSRPIPASPSAAATLRLAGNPAAPSLAPVAFDVVAGDEGVQRIFLVDAAAVAASSAAEFVGPVFSDGVGQ